MSIIMYFLIYYFEEFRELIIITTMATIIVTIMAIIITIMAIIIVVVNFGTIFAAIKEACIIIILVVAIFTIEFKGFIRGIMARINYY